MKVLLSIRPEYAEKIFSGEKKFEYRRSLFKNGNIKSIIVYATKPVGKVIGEFEIDEILTGTPKKIWSLTKKYSGIEKEKFTNYFVDKEEGFAIKIKKTKRYKKSKTLRELSPDLKVAPQSFRYIGG